MRRGEDEKRSKPTGAKWVDPRASGSALRHGLGSAQAWTGEAPTVAGQERLQLPSEVLEAPLGAKPDALKEWLQTVPGGRQKYYGYGFHEGQIPLEKRFFAVGALFMYAQAAVRLAPADAALEGLHAFAEALNTLGIPGEGIRPIAELVRKEEPPRTSVARVFARFFEPLNVLLEFYQFE